MSEKLYCIQEILIDYTHRTLSFEKDISALKQALDDTEQRIKKLEEHKESELKKLGTTNDETIRRLERNLQKLQEKKQLILEELESE